MIGFNLQIVDQMKRVTDATEKATFRNLGHAANRIMKDAKASLVTAEGPSPEGQPPHTHRGAYLRRAVRYDHDRKDQIAVIGPVASIVGDAGAAHEFGGEFRGEEYPERKFMLPALEKNIDRFAGDWAGSITE